MSDMRKYLDILEGKKPQPEEVDEGIKDWALSKIGNKKAQGQQQRAQLVKQFRNSWNQWIGQTGNAGSIQDIQTFLVNIVGFKPDEVQKVLSSIQGLGVRIPQQESKRVWFPKNRIDEAPQIPLTKSQISTILDAAARFVYNDIANQNPDSSSVPNDMVPKRNNSNQQSNQSQKQNTQSQPKQQTQNQTQNQKPQQQTQQSQPEQEPEQPKDTQSSSGDNTFKGTGTFMSNVKRLGLDSEDVIDLSNMIKKGDVDINGLKGDDANMVKSIGWAYLKSLKTKG